jgi:hypothetical protein
MSRLVPPRYLWPSKEVKHTAKYYSKVGRGGEDTVLRHYDLG